MTTMIEKVAAAILDEQEKNRSAFPDNRDLARAAIKAMRDPTSEMVKVGLSFNPVASPSMASAVPAYILRLRYSAMMDAAITEIASPAEEREVTEIPEDVMKAARRLAAEGFVNTFEAPKLIAAAILAERNRCLGHVKRGHYVAEAVGPGLSASKAVWQGISHEELAKAIETGEQP